MQRRVPAGLANVLGGRAILHGLHMNVVRIFCVENEHILGSAHGCPGESSCTVTVCFVESNGIHKDRFPFGVVMHDWLDWESIFVVLLLCCNYGSDRYLPAAW
jgi:hypothetical protein